MESLKGYTSKYFKDDLSAGLTVAIMLVPQGMAYAYLAGMPPIYGLYGGLVPLFLYALLGTSRQLSIGPVAVSALLVLEGFRQIAEPGSSEYIQLVIFGGLLIGVIQVILSMLRLGFLVNFLSHPVLAGFTSAAAIIIAVSQLKDFLGIHIPRFSHTYETVNYALEHLREANWISVTICTASIAVMLSLRSISRSIPGALIVVVVATIISWGFDLEQYGLETIKNVPEGLPHFGFLLGNLETVQVIMPIVLTIAIIGIVESISIAKVLEAKHEDYDIRPNQELFALGISKIGGAFFQAIPTSGSFTRSAINDDSGGRTTISSMVTALLIALTLLFLTPLFYYLPKAVLAAIILLAVRSLFDYKEAIFLWKTDKRDLLLLLITFQSTLVLGIEEGVLTGVLISMGTVLLKSSKPHYGILGKVQGTNNYRNIERFPDAEQMPDELLIRFDDQLYFANAAYFKDVINERTEPEDGIKAVFMDARSMHHIDSSGLHALTDIHSRLKRLGIEFYMASAIGPVMDLLHKAGFCEKVGEAYFFQDLHKAVLAYRERKNKKNYQEG